MQFTGLRLKRVHAAICQRAWETSQSNILKINVPTKDLGANFQENIGSNS